MAERSFQGVPPIQESNDYETQRIYQKTLDKINRYSSLPSIINMSS